jgi:coenzyme F420-reducing hydrogenase delta subunit
MALKCRECRECNGIACAGEIPGLGGKDTGRAFIRNVQAMQNVKINMDVCADDLPITSSAEVFGMKMKMPVFMAPISGIQNNYGADISEYDYSMEMLKGCREAGIYGFTGDGINAEDMFCKPAEAVNDNDGIGIVTIKPWVQEGIDERLQMLAGLKYSALAMDIDAAGLPLLRKGKTPVENKNAEKLRYVKKKAGKPFIVKGIMTVHAALTAVRAGADAIVVSNHGGRVMDDTPGTMEVLPEIADAVMGRAAVLLDGGVRSGIDVFKALAAGADGVLVGRPFALACVKGGSEELKDTILLYQDQLLQTMRMTGCHSIADITADRIRFM